MKKSIAVNKRYFPIFTTNPKNPRPENSYKFAGILPAPITNYELRITGSPQIAHFARRRAWSPRLTWERGRPHVKKIHKKLRSFHRSAISYMCTGKA
jgi:hypothetical protein